MPNFSKSNPLAGMMDLLAFANPIGAEEKPSNPYVDCWCGSQKKWKFCHKDRDKKTPIPSGARHDRGLKSLQSGPCLHPSASIDSCSGPFAGRSHTVQRRGGLAAISEAGHVYSFKKGLAEIRKNNGEVGATKVGVQDASTFRGFCNRHDTQLFKPVESIDCILNRYNAFLLSFRGIAYELATKTATLVNLPIERGDVDYGRPFRDQVALHTIYRWYEDGLRNGVNNLIRHKQEYDGAYLRRDFSSFQAYGVSFDSILPVVAAGAFMPVYDFVGEQLQDLSGGTELEQLALNITVLNGKTVAVFGWMGSTDGPAGHLVQAFSELPDSQKTDAILNIAFEHLENICFTPSWWDGLAPAVKDFLDSKVASGVLYREATALSLLSPERITDAYIDAVFDYRQPTSLSETYHGGAQSGG